MATEKHNRPDKNSKTQSHISPPKLGLPTIKNPLRSGDSCILIVDDNPDVLRLVSKMTMRLGFQPWTADDAVDALSCLKRIDYDIVLTDYEMPMMDGFQLATQIKKAYAETIVIIMTGCFDQDLADMLNGSAMVDGLLLKPFNLKSLKEKIEHIYPHA